MPTQKGSKAGVVMVETTAIGGKILAIDTGKQKVTYLDPEDKKKTVRAKDGVDLSGLAVGGSIDARKYRAKPQEDLC